MTQALFLSHATPMLCAAPFRSVSTVCFVNGVGNLSMCELKWTSHFRLLYNHCFHGGNGVLLL